jgi:hypothetical protein
MSIEISSHEFEARRKRVRSASAIVGGVNFVAFVWHSLSDGTCATFAKSRLVDGQYLVTSHGKEISFSQGGYWFSFWHGIVFVVVHIICMIAIWCVRRKED